jgi:hypothetical protein
MGLLETTGFLLALAMLAGLNVYLTIFLTGLAVRLEWFHWASQIEALHAFGHPVVLGVALVLFLVEFGIDKVPWADSLWDSIHSFLRPAGGVLLAVAALGVEAGTFVQVLVALGAGAAALLTHLARAGLRLGINTSPEPFSNIGASVVEDLAVIGGYILAVNNPLAALVVFGLVLAVIIYLTPGTLRRIRAMLWLIWKKLRVPANRPHELEPPLPNKLPAEEQILVGQALTGVDSPIAWAVHCVTGKTRGQAGLARNQIGYLVAHDKPGTPLCFAGRKNFTRGVDLIDLTDCEATFESHFLFESLVVFSKTRKLHVVFRFHRGQDGLAERLAAYLRARLGLPDPVGEGENEATSGPSASPAESKPGPASDLVFPEPRDHDPAADGNAAPDKLPSLPPLGDLAPSGSDPDGETLPPASAPEREPT